MLIGLMLWATTAQAGEIEGLTITDFGGGEGTQMAGNGWDGGYEADPWWASGGVAFSLTDDGVDDPGQRFGEGSAADNWLLNGPAVEDGVLRVDGQNDDDDFLGVVFQHDGASSFFLVGITQNSAPPPLDDQNPRQGPQLVVFRVENGEAEILLVQGLDGNDGSVNLEVSYNDGLLEVLANGVPAILETPSLGPGRSGFYAYNTGWDGRNNDELAYFFSYSINWLDDDDDNVANDVDNCEVVPNSDQADGDGDGIGDACDEDDPTDPDPDPDPDPEGPTIAITNGGCGCSSTPSALWSVWLAPLALIALRRRRAS